MSALELTRTGNRLGVVLPPEIVARSRREKGDTVFATRAANGPRFTPVDPALDERLRNGREFTRDRQNRK
jgi:hypothetical protein